MKGFGDLSEASRGPHPIGRASWYPWPMTTSLIHPFPEQYAWCMARHAFESPDTCMYLGRHFSNGRDQPGVWTCYEEWRGPETSMARKIGIREGARMYGFNPPNTIDYNTDPAAAKGAMSAEPPSTYTPDDLHWCREYVMAKEHSYRHGDGDMINAAFFDGHVEGLRASTKSPLPFRGEAVHPKYYYPSGTVIKDPSRLHMSTIPAGTILP